ncbi:caspase family protein [Sphaerotilus microaerophilus]|uniref:Peptidase C14 caspase domain-containing protein n=1 Tax=Sphaerotilus microaerophilus TaxID=2914710 RepID=A0ABM7YNE8_9BURK|nr:caspase family protein [Sphaerotilus sp. FB-5]BDI05986.1 hypothetical protein CATMQ487_29560 [Sphaerotilus sp. FB-5]
MRTLRTWLICAAALLPTAGFANEPTQAAGRAKLMTQTGHANSLGLLSSMSPNGNLVATADSSVIKIWNADLGRLVCELKPQQAQATAKPTSRRSKASDEEHDGQAGSAFSFAWSGDSQSLYVPYGDRLVRQDLIRCAEAETLQVRLPDPRQGARQPEDPQRDPIDISEVSTLQNGKILIRTRSGLYLAEIQANRVRAEVLSHIEQKKQKLDPSKLDFKDIISGKGMEGLMDMLMDSLQELKIGAHSADGSVVALTARTITLGPMMLPMSRAETLLSINGSLVPLSSFQGAAPSYKGVSLAAVSAQGKWLAVRAGAQQGAEISLFDLQQRRLVKRFTVNYQGGAKPADSPLSTIIQPLYEQDTAVAGMAFSPDEQQLLLLRNRRDAGETEPDDSMLEIRRVVEVDKLARTISLRGPILPPGFGMTRMSSVNGSSVTPSADQQSFFFVAGPTLVAARWKTGVPVLNSWRAAEGPVNQVAFEDDAHLISTHSQHPENDPDRPVKKQMSLQDMAETAVSPFTMTQQTLRWSLADGAVARVRSGQTVMMSEAIGPNLGRVGGNRVLTTRFQAVTLEKAIHEVRMEQVGADQPVWTRQFSAPEGRTADPRGLAISPDQKLAVVLLHFRKDGPGRQSSQAAESAPGTQPAPQDRAVLLGSILGGIGGRLKQAVPFSKNPIEWQLQLLDAESGVTLGSLDIEKFKSSQDHAPVFLNGQRLLVNQALIDWKPEGAGLQLTLRTTKAIDGKLVGVTPESHRPIVAGKSADAALQALMLPPEFAQATQASASKDDRWVAVHSGGQAVVLDGQNRLRTAFQAPLEGEVATSLAVSPNGRHLAVGTTRGEIRLFELAGRKAQIGTLLGLAGGNWVVIDPDNRIDSSNLGANPALHWVMDDDPLRPVPFDTVMRAFHTPDLLPQIFEGGADLGSMTRLADRNRVTPQVSIDQVEAMPGKPGLVRVKVSVTPQSAADGKSSGAQDLRLFRNGRLVAYAPEKDGALEIDAKSGRFTRTFENIRLPAGGSTVSFQAYAFNADRIRSKVAALDFKPTKPVTLPRGKAYVLAIGVNAYDGQAFNTLAYAVNDARLISMQVAASLRRAGEFGEVVTVTLESEAAGGSSATKSRIQAALGLLAGQPDKAKVLAGVPGADKLAAATPADLVLVTFAGHGYVSDLTGDLHIVPSDVGAAAGVSGLGRFDARSISTSEIDRWLRDIDAGQMALVLDACHSAAAVSAGYKAGPMGSRGLDQLAYDKGIRILAATQAEDTALEHRKVSSGLLTYALVKEGLVANRADVRPNDGRVDLLEWLRYPTVRVPELQAELASGSLKVMVEGEGARGVAKPAAKPRLQTPKLYDYVPAGNGLALIQAGR